MSREYTKFEVWNDWRTKYKFHLFHLMGLERGTNHLWPIASFSLKTNKIILKDVDNFIPTSGMLNQFMSIARDRANKIKESS